MDNKDNIQVRVKCQDELDYYQKLRDEMEEGEDWDPEIEAMYEGPYQDGLWEGMKTKESYQDGLLACPYKKGSDSSEQWLSGYANGYAIRSY